MASSHFQHGNRPSLTTQQKGAQEASNKATINNEDDDGTLNNSYSQARSTQILDQSSLITHYTPHSHSSPSSFIHSINTLYHTIEKCLKNLNSATRGNPSKPMPTGTPSTRMRTEISSPLQRTPNPSPKKYVSAVSDSHSSTMHSPADVYSAI